ncbi:trypsin-like peptidase domain-containing protein [Streptomyces africanus]|uniref:VMAP-C domain-containing protein n=1 Tax=Streptomyces africanus TaxID=231024 RepID=UPI000D19B587|nr:trypsin-like peptidase domain-containing protein [Streptomyces africanus]
MRRRHDDDPDARIRRAWVTVHADRAAGAGLGAGVVVADGFLLTCAHVVNAALGRPKLAAAQPTPQDMRRVTVSFPCLGSEHHAVELASWLAPRAEHEHWWDGDLALLKVDPGASEVTPVPIRETATRTPWTWYASGAPRSLVDVRVQADMGPWYILDPGHAPLRIQHGHSGAPLWDRENACVTGLVVSTERDNPRSYAIRASEILKLLAGTGVHPPVPAPEPDPRTRARRDELVDALDELPHQKLERCATRVGRALGLHRVPDTCEELVDAVLRHPRGIPALLNTLIGHEAVARRIRDTAAKLGPLRLLTQHEYDELATLLGPSAHPEVRAAARRAVPHFSLPDTGPPAAGTLIEDLEDRAGEPGVVPPVIQVVEEVAAARQEGGDALREWSDRVTERLGVSPEAVRQCRWSAKSRASARTSQPVLRVWLWAAETGAESFHYVMRLYDTHGHLVRTWTDGDTLRSRDELCADLSDAVEDLDQYDDGAGVEFLLEEGFFSLAVDRLPTRGPLGPRPVGRDRVVVVRGQQVPRSGDWKARWEHGRSSSASPYVLLDQRTADRFLTSRRDIACVIACCPPGQHDGALALCRWLGVPVVLWHRGAHGPDRAEELRKVVPQDWPRGLREEVTQRRAEAADDNTHLGAGLALLWEDPSWAPPQRRLVNPTRRKGGVV